MKTPSMRVRRKVKIDGKWLLATVPLDAKGRPSAHLVLHKGREVHVDGGTFYLEHGYGRNRQSITCGTNPDSVKRAMQTQAHVVHLRNRGMEVDDAPEILEARKSDEGALRAIATEYKAHPPAGHTLKTVKKYLNAFRTFAEFASTAGVTLIAQVNKDLVTRWISHLQRTEKLDAATVVPKVNIVLAELERRGNKISLEKRALPKVVTREREIYQESELKALFRACTTEEYEVYQTFLHTGLRRREVAFLGPEDFDLTRATVRVIRKRDLGFVPKTYHERTVPVPRSYLEIMEGRVKRKLEDGEPLLFGTSRAWRRRGNAGGRADTKQLEKLQALALREGLNCGRCRGMWQKKPATCAHAPICKTWGLHKFRHTYATSMLRDKVDIVTVSKWLGHKDLATTRIYLHALEAEMAQPQVEASTLATQFAWPAPNRPKTRRPSRSRKTP